jgi:AraC-like DNA-binding protein
VIDDIYLRLLNELAPNNLRLKELDAQRLISFEDSKDAYSQLVRSIYEQDEGSSIGLEYGKYLKPHALCDFSRTLMTAKDFRSSLHLIDTLHYMQGTSYYLSINHSEEHTSISLCYPYKDHVSSRQKRFCCEAVFFYILNLARDSMGQNINPCALYLDIPKPEYSAEYAAVFKCPIIYDSPLAMMAFDANLLARPLSTSNDTLHQLYLNKCCEQVRRAEKQWSITYRVITQLIRNHPTTFSGSELAGKLNISVRGLQKRLNKDKSSFSELSALARRELVKVYLLQKHTPIEVVCENLGFQTVSGFRRFVKSEFHQTLAEFLDSHTSINIKSIDAELTSLDMASA